jgi:hypothetical protein
MFLVSFISVYSQVGIGTLHPNESAQLEIVSKNKGVLIPQIALRSLSDSETISNGNVTGLLVYNTTNSTTLTPGYYYWSNNHWTRLLVFEDVKNRLLPSILDQQPTSGVLTFTNNYGERHVAQLISSDLGNTLSIGSDGGAYIKITPKAETNTYLTQNINTGTLSYHNEGGKIQDANIISTDVGNIVTVGSDGGAMLSPTALASSETTTTMAQAVSTGVVSYTDEDG